MSRKKPSGIKALIALILRTSCVTLMFVSMPIIANIQDSDIQDDDTYFRGKDTFMHYCARCHGVKANGHGRIAAIYIKMGKPRPSNFTAGIYALRPEGYLRKIVTNGGSAYGLSEYMPPFKGELSDTQMDDVLHFIRTTSKLHKVIAKQE